MSSTLTKYEVHTEDNGVIRVRMTSLDEQGKTSTWTYRMPPFDALRMACEIRAQSVKVLDL